MAHCESYVICTSPRCGSTLLCNLLAATGVAGNPDSYFHQPSLARWLDRFHLVPDPDGSERDHLAAIFQAAIAEGRGETGVFGLRLQRHSFDFFARKLAVLYPAADGDAARFRAAFGRTLFIHLSRRDKVAQAVSHVMASQTGLWHRGPDGTELERLSPPREPDYDACEIAARLAEATADDRHWEDWFARARVTPFRLTYEALSDEPTETLKLVLGQLGQDRKAAVGIVPGVAKLADQTSRSWVARIRSRIIDS